MRLNQWGVIEEEDPEPDPDDPGPDEDPDEVDYDFVREHSVCIECGQHIWMQKKDEYGPDGAWHAYTEGDYGDTICYADYADASSWDSPPEAEPYPHEPQVQAWEVAEAVQSIQREIEARGGPA